MTPAELQKKRLWLLLTIGYFLSGYYFIDWLNHGRVITVPPNLPGETLIPFWPGAIYAYLLVGPCVFLFYRYAGTWPLYWRGIRTYWLLFAIHAVCYLLYPITIARPTPISDGSLTLWLTQLYFTIDPPRNLFPSFHVSQCLLFSLLFWNTRKPWGYILLAMTTLVALSTIFLKQHYIADVLAAIPLTVLVLRLVRENEQS